MFGLLLLVYDSSVVSVIKFLIVFIKSCLELSNIDVLFIYVLIDSFFILLLLYLEDLVLGIVIFLYCLFYFL